MSGLTDELEAGVVWETVRSLCLPGIAWHDEQGWELLTASLRAALRQPAPVAGSDWFAGDVDCDGNELVTIRADEAMPEDQIKHMVERFLMWKLPQPWQPDAGIKFKPSHADEPMRSRHWPIGTNLFDYTQALAMVRHMTAGHLRVHEKKAMVMVDDITKIAAGLSGTLGKFCTACQAIPSSGYCNLEGCPMMPAPDANISDATKRMAATLGVEFEINPRWDVAAPDAGDMQAEVDKWMDACFGETIKADQTERADRFIEEALELAQTMPGFNAGRAHALVDYTFSRPVGDRGQEVGGVMVTLAALCNAVGISIDQEFRTELARVWMKVEVIRAKQASKPTGSALPVADAGDMQGLLGFLDALAYDCEGTDGWEDGAKDIRRAITAIQSLTAERDNANSYAAGIAKQGLVREAEVIALTTRLEMVPGWSQDADGIACRDATIEGLDEQLAAERAKVAELVEGLEWYTDPISYAVTQMAEPRSAIHADQGRRARALIERMEP